MVSHRSRASLHRPINEGAPPTVKPAFARRMPRRALVPLVPLAASHVIGVPDRTTMIADR
jgi:hypothetical protein